MSKFISARYAPALLLLESGQEFSGYAVGALGQTTAELVFNTTMTGYQEVLTDPSYKEQMVVFSTPHIGNTGVNRFDTESDTIMVAGMVVREISTYPSSWRSEGSLPEYLKKHNIIAISGVDTRRIVQIIRDSGTKIASIMAGEEHIDRQKAQAIILKKKQTPPADLVLEVSTSEIRTWHEPSNTWFQENSSQDFSLLTQHKKSLPETAPHIVVYDFGAKQQILRLLVDRGCRVTLVPAQTTAETVLNLAPDGVLLSNGPGNPSDCLYAVEAAKTFIAKSLPLLGICLGFQIIALACGAKTKKMPFGHHGANHPVAGYENGKERVYITSQNHGFCVDISTLPKDYQLTHKSLFDQTAQGFQHKEKPILGLQGHPEGSPGPHSLASIFDQFLSYFTKKV